MTLELAAASAAFASARKNKNLPQIFFFSPNHTTSTSLDYKATRLVLYLQGFWARPGQEEPGSAELNMVGVACRPLVRQNWENKIHL